MATDLLNQFRNNNIHAHPMLSRKLSPRFSHKFAEIRSWNLDA